MKSRPTSNQSMKPTAPREAIPVSLPPTPPVAYPCLVRSTTIAPFAKYKNGSLFKRNRTPKSNYCFADLYFMFRTASVARPKLCTGSNRALCRCLPHHHGISAMAASPGSKRLKDGRTETRTILMSPSHRSNQSMKPTAPFRNKSIMIATAPYRGLSLSR